MQNIEIYGSVDRCELIKKETEFMFEDARNGLDREDKDAGLYWYYFKLGDQRFTIKNQAATGMYVYNLNVEMDYKPTKEQEINIKNVFEAYLKLKGEAVLDCIKNIEKVLKKDFNIACKLTVCHLEKALSGNFHVNHSAFSKPIDIDLVSAQSEKIVTTEKTEEVGV